VHGLGNNPFHAGGSFRRRAGTWRQRHCHKRASWRSVVGEPALAERDLGSHPLRYSPFELGALRSAAPAHRGDRRSRVADGLVDGLPAGAAAEVGSERPIEVDPRATTLRSQRCGAHDDPGGAEATLRSAVIDEAGRDRFAFGSVETFDRSDHSSGHPGYRGHTGDPRVSVDEHGAAPALPLWRATVLRRNDAHALSEHGEQRLARKRIDHDRFAVARERNPMPSNAHGEAG
jgi:hypothetical protein